jgi:predicted small lipoprotein YifL
MTLKTTARLALVLVLSATTMAACGRKGDLDPPGPATTTRTTVGPDAKKQAIEDKPFILDALL